MKYEILYRSQIMQGHIEDYDIYTKCNGKLLKFFKIIWSYFSLMRPIVVTKWEMHWKSA